MENYHQVSQWKLEYDIFQRQNCFALIFGSIDGDLTIPRVSLSLDSPENIETELDAPSNCFIAVIGVEYIDQLSDVLTKLDKISSSLASTPSLMIIDVNHVDDSIHVSHGINIPDLVNN